MCGTLHGYFGVSIFNIIDLNIIKIRKDDTCMYAASDFSIPKNIYEIFQVKCFIHVLHCLYGVDNKL